MKIQPPLWAILGVGEQTPTKAALKASQKTDLLQKTGNGLNLSSGVYFIKVSDEKGNVRMGKFVKE